MKQNVDNMKNICSCEIEAQHIVTGEIHCQSNESEHFEG
jgi:hypothetical protein